MAVGHHQTPRPFFLDQQLQRQLAELVMREEEIEIRELAELAGRYAAFGSSVLHIANSSAFGVRRTIHSAEHAVLFLGLRRARRIAERFLTSVAAK
ncbi:MAG: HDOD domain-containing protein [bacterium]|nr:HDOD domain-containing protein [bacterium]